MFQLIILLSALFIASCAAWFSIFGISQLFVGALISARVMALSLEIGKLAVVSFAYRYWKKIGWWLRGYMLIGAIVLSVITSAGIYGYLSAAYAVSAVDFSAREGEVAVMTTRQSSINSLVESNERRLRELESYRTNQETRLNQLVGQRGFVTQQTIVRQAETDIRNLRSDNSRLVVERDSLEVAKTQTMNIAITTNKKVGTFWYVARALGVELDKVITWFILAIVAVFDPLAIALILAYNFMVREKLGQVAPVEKKKKEKKKEVPPTESPIKEESPEIKAVPQQIIQERFAPPGNVEQQSILDIKF